MSRPRSEVAQARVDAAWCLHELHTRRWKYTVIARRLGVCPQTVHRWKQGLSAPRSARELQRLISLTRAAMQFPVPVERLVGMSYVIESVRRALGLSARALSRRLSLRESAVANWRFSGYAPGRAATLKLRALLLELDHPEQGVLLNICDARLRELGRESKRRSERFRRLRDVQFNRDALDKLRLRARGALPLADT
jgi:DNA-binding transcriptional regulator YiaG